MRVMVRRKERSRTRRMLEFSPNSILLLTVFSWFWNPIVREEKGSDEVVGKYAPEVD